MTHTPRFTAKAPDSRAVVTKARLGRCKTVADCDRELRELRCRMSRSTHPTLVASVLADIDGVLDRRTELAAGEAETLALEVAREAR